MARKRIDSLPDAPFLAVARRAARDCGVTRLADITGLDRIGLPVWQAVRPASRALSVHQGKGLTAAGAQIGALCEAIESHWAEQVEADGPCAAWVDLPEPARLCHPDDLLADRARPADWSAPIQWCVSRDLVNDRTVYLPHAFVSLDFRSGFPSRIERSSNGLGAGPDEASAIATALFELIERDALAVWGRSGLAARLASRIEPDSIPFGWFGDWRERLATLGTSLAVFALESITGAPAFRCEIAGAAGFAPGLRRSSGAAAHADAEIALGKAFAEAAQTRLTLIAGARDDLYPRHFAPPAVAPTDDDDDDDDDDDAPLGRRWRDAPAVADPIAHTVECLAERGYRDVLVKRLDAGAGEVWVVKAFVPGLALFGRSRRVTA